MNGCLGPLAYLVVKMGEQAQVGEEEEGQGLHLLEHSHVLTSHATCDNFQNSL